MNKMIRERQPALLACISAKSKERPSKLNLHFSIGKFGSISGVSSRLPSGASFQGMGCFYSMFKGANFSAVEANTVVRYPILFDWND